MTATAHIDLGLARRRVRAVIGRARTASQLIRRVHDRDARVAVFGGLVRDMLQVTPAQFSSDLDLVVDGLSTEQLAAIIDDLPLKIAQRNKFGGWRLGDGDSRIDIWPLHMTWAFREGHVHGGDFGDLLHTTFFDQDAVVYDLTHRRLHVHPRARAAWAAGVVELNLVTNPNPFGAVLRTLRLAARPDLHVGPRLTRWLVEHGTRYAPAELCRAEQSRWPSSRRLTRETVRDLLDAARVHLDATPLLPFGATRPVQLSLAPCASPDASQRASRASQRRAGGQPVRAIEKPTRRAG